MLIIIVSISSCTDGLVPKLESTPSARGDGCVWRVKSKSGGALYLCGTIHLLREEDYPLPEAYQLAYADSKRLLFELPPGSSEGGGMVAQMQKLGTLPPGQTLESIIGPSLAAEVIEWGKRQGQTPEALMRYHPWFVALLIAAVEYGALGAQPDKGVDSYFEAMARQDKKTGEGLETVDFQLGLFTELSASQQKDLLQQTLKEVETMSAEFARLIEAWKGGDLETLREMLFREAEQYPELMDVFLHRRNQAWLPKLEKAMESNQPVMVLVGAGHFTGTQGLIALLKARGHTVERVLSCEQ